MRVVCEGGTGKLTPNFAPQPTSAYLRAGKRGQGEARYCSPLAAWTVMAKPLPALELPACRLLCQRLALSWRQPMPVELQLPSTNERFAVRCSKAPCGTLPDGARMLFGRQGVHIVALAIHLENRHLLGHCRILRCVQCPIAIAQPAHFREKRH